MVRRRLLPASMHSDMNQSFNLAVEGAKNYEDSGDMSVTGKDQMSLGKSFSLPTALSEPSLVSGLALESTVANETVA